MKTQTITDPAAHDRAARLAATSDLPLETITEPVLIHAIRYCGPGWNPERRKALVREFRRRLSAHEGKLI